MLVDDNDIVSAGDPLLRIDPRPFQLAVDNAQVQLQQAMQSLDASSAQLEASYAEVARMRATLENARADARRIRTLAKRDLVADVELDAAETRLSTAEAGFDAITAQATAAERQIGVTGEANPQVRSAKLALEKAEYDLLSTTVTAPHSGVVTNLGLAPGQFAGPGTPLMTFIDAQAVWITAELRENQLRGIDPDDSVSIVFDALPGVVFDGHVESLGWGISSGRREANGLLVNSASTQWFEPARKMPVRVVLDREVQDWPRTVKLGGKADVLIHAHGASHPVSLIGASLQRVGSWLSIFY